MSGQENMTVKKTSVDRRGSTQGEALATRSVEKNLELIFSIVTPLNIGAKITVLMRAFKWYVI